MNILHTSIGKGLTINRGTLKDRPLQVGQASAAPAQAQDFPVFWSWEASVCSAQAGFPGIPSEMSFETAAKPDSRVSGLGYRPKTDQGLVPESDLQNTGTAIALGRVWKADRSEKRANILTDLSHSYALYSPGSWIGVPAFCRIPNCSRAADVSQDQFPGIPVLAGLCRPYPALIPGILVLAGLRG